MWSGCLISEYVTKESQHMKEALLSHVYQGIIHNSEDMGSTKVSTDKSVEKKMCYLYAGDY